MKYVYQMGIITGISFGAEVLRGLVPLPVPASVYGLAALFMLLYTGVLKEKHIKETADFLIAVMPLMFIAPSVGLMSSFSLVKGRLAALIVMCALSTAAVMAGTAACAQAVIRLKRRREDTGNE